MSNGAPEQVIYRDFKTSNILLDGNLDAKLSDFGLARNGPQGEQSHVSTRVSTAAASLLSLLLLALALAPGRSAAATPQIYLCHPSALPVLYHCHTPDLPLLYHCHCHCIINA